MCDCDLDRPGVWNEATRKARVAHKCSECRHPINKGETYNFIEALYDGVWEKFKICQECDRLISTLNLDCYEMGGFYQCLVDDEFVAKDDSGFWVSNLPSIKVVSQRPLKCVAEVAA